MGGYIKRALLFVFAVFVFAVLGFLFSPKANAACTTAPGLTKGAQVGGESNVTYTLTVKNNCSTSQKITLTSPSIPSGWSYQYYTKDTNGSYTIAISSITLSAYSSATVKLTITRPTGATEGYYNVYARATLPSGTYTQVTLKKYLVCGNCTDKGWQCGSFTTTCGGQVSTQTVTCTCASSAYTCSNHICLSPTSSPTPSVTPTPSITNTPQPPPTTYACVNYVCTSVSDGSGYGTRTECDSNCKAPTTLPCASELSALAPAGIPVGGLCMVNRMIQLSLNLLLIASVVLAIFYLAWGGITWILSEGDKQKLAQAKHRITIAIIGLVVIFVSFAILNILQFLFKVG